MTPKLPSAIILAAWAGLVLTQQCYYAKDKKTDPRVTNCTSTDGLMSLCCFSGHTCLEEAACFDPESKATYLYGCTDPNYSDIRCPVKWGFNMDASPWVGVTTDYCSASHDPWYGIHPDANCGDKCPPAPWGPVPFDFPNLRCDDIKNKKLAFNKTKYHELESTAVAQIYTPPAPKPPSTSSKVTSDTPPQMSTSIQTAVKTSVKTSVFTDGHTVIKTTLMTSLQTVTVVDNPTMDPGLSPSSAAVTQSAALSDEKKRNGVIAIGLGVVVAAFLLGAGIFFWWRWHKKRSARVSRNPPPSYDSKGYVIEHFQTPGSAPLTGTIPIVNVQGPPEDARPATADRSGTGTRLFTERGHGNQVCNATEIRGSESLSFFNDLDNDTHLAPAVPKVDVERFRPDSPSVPTRPAFI